MLSLDVDGVEDVVAEDGTAATEAEVAVVAAADVAAGAAAGVAVGAAAGAVSALGDGAGVEVEVEVEVEDPDELDDGATGGAGALADGADAPDEGAADVATGEAGAVADPVAAEPDELDDGATAFVTGAVADLTVLVTPETAVLTPETSEGGPDAEALEATRRQSARARMPVAIVQRGLSLSLCIRGCLYPVNPKLIPIG